MLGRRTFRVFVSSTFTDFRAERDRLQELVFDPLIQHCTERGFGFQAVDLRWGIREEASSGQRTMRICLSELERCQKTSPRPNFVVMLGDRYGWRPLPETVEAQEFESVVARLSPQDRAAAETAYYRDDNCVPPAYVLAPLDGSRTYDAEALRGALEAAARDAGLAEDALIKYMASATEQEIINGALRVPDAAEHVFAFLRAIDGLPERIPPFDPQSLEPSDADPAFFRDFKPDGSLDADAAARLAALKSRLKEKLGENVFEYRAAWSDTGMTTDHVESLCADLLESLRSVIDAEIERLSAVSHLEVERAAHDDFAKERRRGFVGRTQYLSRIADYLSERTGHPLCIYAPGGLGKSALMAQAIAQARDTYPEAALVARFIGVTPASSDLRSLLADLCAEIGEAYGVSDEVPTTLQELVPEFKKRLGVATGHKPLLLFIDSLDQLSSTGGVSASWIPAELPEHCCLVLSTRPSLGDSGSAHAGGSGTLFDSLLARIPDDHVVELAPMPVDEGRQLLENWLAASDPPRTLQPLQKAELLGRFGLVGSPLYLRLAFEEARLWPSRKTDIFLGADVPTVIGDLYDRLENEHGRELVAHALGFIAISRDRLGLSENDLMAALAADDAVWQEFTAGAKWRVDTRRLPPVVWSRLYFDLAPYLSERNSEDATVLGFFHKELGDVAFQRYARGQEASLHGVLADVFYRQAKGLNASEREWKGTAHGLAELPYHLTGAERWDEVFALLTDFTFLEEKARRVAVMSATDAEGNDATVYNGVMALIDDYDRALAVFPEE